MSVEFESKNRLSSLIDAANATTGNTDADLTTAIRSLVEGYGSGGGNANTYSGDMVTDAATSIPASGLTLSLGLPSRVKWFFMWFDRDDFIALESVANNYYGFVVMFPVTLSEILPIRMNATALVPDTSDRFFMVGSYYNTTSGSENGYASTGIIHHATANTEIWAANEDGTITISRFGSATTTLFAGTYHWIAVC